MTGVRTMQMILVLAVMIMILVPAAAGEQPVADFIAQDAQTTGFAPFTVWFEDRSTGAASWAWSFGDGETSSQPNPSHTYTGAGTWTVSLTVQDTTGTLQSTKTIPDYIVVAADPHGGPVVTTHATTTTPAVTSTTHALTGTVAVRSSPSGAMVSLDGEEKGITPITLYGVPAGSHTVLVHLKGFRDFRETVSVEHQQTATVDADLSSPTTTATTPGQTTIATQTTGPVAATAQAASPPSPPRTESMQNGSLKIACPGCYDNWVGSFPVNRLDYEVYRDNDAMTAALRYKGSMSRPGESVVILDVPPGHYLVNLKEINENREYSDLRRIAANVTAGRQALASFSFPKQVPRVFGFGALLTAFAIVSLFAVRRLGYMD